MSKLLLLYTTLLIGLMFLLLPTGGNQIDFFLLSDVRITGVQHLYFICEKLVLIILAGIIANESIQYREAIWIFFWLMVADLVDYCLDYNQVWFYISNLPVSMNVIKSVVFGLTIIRELWNKSFK